MHDLASVSTIDIAAYAVMNNHYHAVLYIDKEKALNWPDTEVVLRWQKIFKASSLALRHLQGDTLDHNKFKEIIDLWRNRLMELSWFIRCLNESIARQANAQDNCTGRFWEGRFKSQALLMKKPLSPKQSLFKQVFAPTGSLY
ncbi:hypothetical protein ACJJIE_11970 [Microbulbifer sp. TRSA001]|uniref:hypothetical protein n=1 Tax=Microbulbifer sp. TRSA001 TaxID=3243381 RepID=UPI004039CAD9